jgi:hypothetical protein
MIPIPHPYLPTDLSPACALSLHRFTVTLEEQLFSFIESLRFVVNPIGSFRACVSSINSAFGKWTFKGQFAQPLPLNPIGSLRAAFLNLPHPVLIYFLSHCTYILKMEAVESSEKLIMTF